MREETNKCNSKISLLQAIKTRKKLMKSVVISWEEKPFDCGSCFSQRQDKWIEPQSVPGWASGRISALEEWLSIGTGCPGRCWSHHLWKHSKNDWMWHLVLWLSWWWCSVRGWTLILEVLSYLNDSMILSGGFHHTSISLGRQQGRV